MIPTVLTFSNRNQPYTPASSSNTRASSQSAATSELKRRFATRSAAYQYLSARGFLFLPSGWANGWWRATVDMDGDDYVVVIRLHHMTAA
jgi:hypothetical protein